MRTVRPNIVWIRSLSSITTSTTHIVKTQSQTSTSVIYLNGDPPPWRAGEKDEQLRERQRAAGRKYEEAHAVQRRERQRLAAQRLPPAEQEKIRARQRIHNANYRANHRSHLRKASMRRRSLANPDALPRRGHLYKPEEYAAHQLARHKLVNEFKTTKRRCMKVGHDV
ncbi:hypothetical protein BDZ89DRAFT_815686 [Hymenopellis radicata]|nr:hypothetical protein BDZ89DRAFT_815686 [Hymenopellis radicata]